MGIRILDKSGIGMVKSLPVAIWLGFQMVSKIQTTQWSGLLDYFCIFYPVMAQKPDHCGSRIQMGAEYQARIKLVAGFRASGIQIPTVWI